MERNIEFGDKCLDHENHTVQFVCLNIICSQVALGCVICFRKNHRNCYKNLILDRALLDRLLEIRPAENLDNLKQQIKECIEKDFVNLKQILQQKKEMIMLQFKPFELDVSKLTPDQIIAYKQYSEIKITNDDKIEFSNRIKSSEEIEQDLLRFQKLIRQKLDLHLKIYRNLKFQNHQKIYKDDFLSHESLQLTEKFNGLVVKKTTENFSRVCILTKEPVENISLKINILRHQRTNCCEFGVIDQNQYQKYQNKLQDIVPKEESKFNINSVSYRMGFDQFIQQAPQNIDEMNQFVLYFNYNKRQQTFIVKDQDGIVNAQKKLNSDHNHYFYLCLDLKDQQVYIQKY